MNKIKENFMVGIAVIVPIVATVMFLKVVVNILSIPIVSIFHQDMSPLLSVVLSFVIVLFVGVLAKNFIGKFFLDLLETILSKIPVANVFYKSTKQIVNAFSKSKTNLLSVVLIEYPRKGVWSLAFVTNKNAAGIKSKDGVELTEGKVSVFIPSTPNPTTGFVLFLDKEDVQFLDMSVDEGIKILMSAGIVGSN